MGPTLLTSSLPSSASPSRWSRPACPSHCPSSSSLLSLSVSHSHPSWPVLWRSVLCLVSLSSRRFPSSQLSSARSSLSQLPASLRCPPSPSKHHKLSKFSKFKIFKIQNFQNSKLTHNR